MILLVKATIKRMIILIDTIAAPLGMVKEYANHKPTRTDNSEKIIDITTVALYDQPILMPAATGMTIIEEMSNTPAASNNTDTTTESITIKINWNKLTLMPKNLAFISSKLTAIIFFPKKINSKVTTIKVPRIK